MAMNLPLRVIEYWFNGEKCRSTTQWSLQKINEYLVKPLYMNIDVADAPLLLCKEEE